MACAILYRERGETLADAKSHVLVATEKLFLLKRLPPTFFPLVSQTKGLFEYITDFDTEQCPKMQGFKQLLLRAPFYMASITPTYIMPNNRTNKHTYHASNYPHVNEYHDFEQKLLQDFAHYEKDTDTKTLSLLNQDKNLFKRYR
jgi:hypothetical protein